MILINDHWEHISSLKDISKIIRENYNCDLADKMDELIQDYSYEEYYRLECDLDDAYGEIAVLEDDISKLENDIEILKEKLEEANAV